LVPEIRPQFRYHNSTADRFAEKENPAFVWEKEQDEAFHLVAESAARFWRIGDYLSC
jgi:hypothetical protein